MKKYIFSIMAAAVVLVSCDRQDSLLETEPQGNVSSTQIEDLLKEFPEKAVTVLGGAEAGNNNYLVQFNTNDRGAHDDFGYMSIRTGLDHMTNDLVMTNSHWFNSYYQYVARNVDNSRNEMVWRFNYKVVYNMNEVLKQIPGEQAVPAAKYIKGRALAMRAMAYMDLIRTYAVGDLGIPYYSEGDREISVQSRVATTEVWTNILTDLEESYQLLEGYARPSKESVDQSVVAGFLARAYMETKNYTKAASYANRARQSYPLMSEAQLKDGFQFISNPEWMWGSDINSSTTTLYASFFSHMSNINDGYAGLLGIYRAIDARLYDAIPATDIRKDWFLGAAATVDGYKLPKYANVKFYDDTFFEGDYLYMRAAEFYIIEAEALARSGNETQARAVLDLLVKTRDSAFSASNYSGAALLQEIRKQRKIELWGEGGEWWEMKRFNESLVRVYPGSNHANFGKFDIPAGDPKFHFAIPQKELNANPNVSNP